MEVCDLPDPLGHLLHRSDHPTGVRHTAGLTQNTGTAVEQVLGTGTAVN